MISINCSYISRALIVLQLYRIDRKLGGEFNLAVWRIGQPTAKLKTANIKSTHAVVRELDREVRE